MKKLQKIDDNDQEIGYLDHRKIEQESNWITGEIMSVGENVGTNQFQQIDFSDKHYIWEYVYV